MIKNSAALTGIFVLIFPLFVLGGVWGKTAMDRHVDDNIWRIKITGFDPRDILYGHYLRFRYDWSFLDGQGPKSRGEDCLCLKEEDGGRVNPVALPLQCNVDDDSHICDAIIKVKNHGGRYGFAKNGEPEKYFIPEENANEVDRVFREGGAEFYIELSVKANRSVAVRGLYVEDERLEDYLRRRPFVKENGILNHEQ